MSQSYTIGADFANRDQKNMQGAVPHEAIGAGFRKHAKRINMKIRTMLLLLVLILMAVFLIVNWTALSTVMTVNLVYTEIQAPLGAIVVGSFVALTLILLIYMVWQQASVTMELRAAYKEARNARGVADHAEKSRFQESNRLMSERLEKLEALVTTRSDEMLSCVQKQTARLDERIDRMEKTLKGYSEDGQKRQDEAIEQINKDLSVMEKKLLTGLPAVKKDESAEQKEGQQDADNARKEKKMFGDLF